MIIIISLLTMLQLFTRSYSLRISSYRSSFITRLCSTENSEQQDNNNNYPSDNDLQLENMKKKIRSDLMKWRKIVADEAQKPLYAVLQNRQIDAITTILPRNDKQLLDVPHIGPKTVKSYSNKILEIINKHITASPNITIVPTEYIPIVKAATTSTTTSSGDLKQEGDHKDEEKTTKPKNNKQKVDIRTLINYNIEYKDLSEEQQIAARNVIDHETNVFITGSAGTGKVGRYWCFCIICSFCSNVYQRIALFYSVVCSYVYYTVYIMYCICLICRVIFCGISYKSSGSSTASLRYVCTTDIYYISLLILLLCIPL